MIDSPVLLVLIVAGSFMLGYGACALMQKIRSRIS
jgi:hypothetical protein